MGVQVIYDYSSKLLKVSLPVTLPTGKIRIKRRSYFAEYGIPIVARQTVLGLSDYIEWQIGYDLLSNNENKKSTTLTDTFANNKGENKFAYELSEIIYYSFELGYLSEKDIVNAYSEIKSYRKLIDTFHIKRTNPVLTNINGKDFYSMTVEYPLFVNKYDKYEIYTEIINREKQRAVGVQPMLFLCIPITELKFSDYPIGRRLNAKETADWVIEKKEAELALELFRMFGMLSEKHKFDILAIMKMLFSFI